MNKIRWLVGIRLKLVAPFASPHVGHSSAAKRQGSEAEIHWVRQDRQASGLWESNLRWRWEKIHRWPNKSRFHGLELAFCTRIILFLIVVTKIVHQSLLTTLKSTCCHSEICIVYGFFSDGHCCYINWQRSKMIMTVRSWKTTTCRSISRQTSWRPTRIRKSFTASMRTR